MRSMLKGCRGGSWKNVHGVIKYDTHKGRYSVKANNPLLFLKVKEALN